MNVLIGGDSFGQHGREYYCSQKKDTNFIHWCSSVAKKRGGTFACVAMPGADLKTSSMVTLSELMKGNYTHCFFHVTDFLRLSIENVYATHEENFETLLKISEQSKDIDTEQNRIKKYYSKLEEDFNTQASKDKREWLNLGSMWLTYFTHRKMQNKDWLQFCKEMEITPEEIEKFFCGVISPFLFTDQISRLVSLIAYCNTQNIKLCLVTNFGQLALEDLNIFGNYVFFDPVTKFVHHGDFTWDSSKTYLPSHYTADEHNRIERYFYEIAGENW